MSYTKILVGLLVTLCLTPLPALATLDWDEGFEYSSNAAMDVVWQSSCVGNDVIIRPTTTRPRTGSYSLELTFRGHQGVTPGYQSCYKDRNLSAPTTGTLYSRFWIYIPSSFQVDETTTKLTLQPAYAGDAYTSFWWGMMWGVSLFDVTVQKSWSPPSLGDSSEILYGNAIPRDRWVCLQTRLTYATPGSNNGIVQNWIDGVQGINRSNVYMDQVGQQSVFRAIRMYTQDGLGTMWYDDYAVSRDALPTCDGSSPVGDTTPPPVPSTPTVSAQTLPLVINWSSVTNPGDLSGYKVYRKLEACSGATAVTLLASLGNVLTYTDTTIPNSTTNVCVKVSSYDTSSNESGLSTGLDVSLTPPAASVRVTRVTENFTRANSTDLGSAWDAGYTGATNFQLLSNQIAPGSLNSEALETYNAYTLPADQWACKVFKSAPASDGIVLRFANSPTVTGYYFKARDSNPTARIDKYTAGAYAQVASSGSATPVWGIGDQLCAEVEGTTLRLFRVSGGVSTLLISVTDASFATGKAGMQAYAVTAVNEALGDDFTAGDFTTGTPTGDTFATTASVTLDTTGADLTFTGLATKIRYWNTLHPRTSPVEVTGLGGVASYRLSKTWETDPIAVTWVCIESQGSDGIWESDKVVDSYICKTLPAPAGDVTAPANPSGLGIR